MDRGEGTLGKLSTDDSLYKNATEATANLNKATVELNKLLATSRRTRGSTST